MTAAPTFFGIYPILYAFFDALGRLDRAAMRRQVEGCLAQGAHGIAVLGLATEMGKLTEREKRDVIDWLAADVGGRVPIAITISGGAVAEQVALARHAQGAGASWVILQPPPVRGLPEAEYIRFFGAVMERIELPVAIQNAPDYIGIGLSPAGLATLARAHPNFTLLKGEGPATTIRRVIEETEGKLAVFNGRGGLELPDNLRAGCVGLIPAPECFDVQVRVYEAMRAGNEDEAERLYREILPLIVFLMQSVETFLCYGKRLTARRLGLGPVHDRTPALPPTEFGLACLERLSARLGTF
jgi:dihydrodipicolinate synthase/N-acetylneuraminate lyase